MRLDLEGLLAGHAGADDLGMQILNTDTALRQLPGQAADDSESVVADQLQLYGTQ